MVRDEKARRHYLYAVKCTGTWAQLSNMLSFREYACIQRMLQSYTSAHVPFIALRPSWEMRNKFHVCLLEPLSERELIAPNPKFSSGKQLPSAFIGFITACKSRGASGWQGSSFAIALHDLMRRWWVLPAIISRASHISSLRTPSIL